MKLEENIKSIVKKEQIKQISYKVGEKIWRRFYS